MVAPGTPTCWPVTWSGEMLPVAGGAPKVAVGATAIAHAKKKPRLRFMRRLLVLAVTEKPPLGRYAPAPKRIWLAQRSASLSRDMLRLPLATSPLATPPGPFHILDSKRPIVAADTLTASQS